MLYHNEVGYMQLIRNVLDNGISVPDRTGIGSIALFDAKIVYDTDQIFPFSTYRPAPLRMAFEEWWFFMRGETDTKILEAKGINFWQPQTTRKFLDSRGMTDFPEGSMGTSYGFQFRNFGGVYGQPGTGVDQLVTLYEGLRDDPYGRRHYVSFWNAQQSPTMALTPCWHSHQFVVLPDEDGNDTLHLKLQNRSLDLVLGLPMAVSQYALYQKCMAKLLNMKVGKLSCDLSQVHIYNNQIEYAKELVKRPKGIPGRVTILKELHTLEDVVSMVWDDFRIEGLIVNKNEFITPRPPMAV